MDLLLCSMEEHGIGMPSPSADICFIVQGLAIQCRSLSWAGGIHQIAHATHLADICLQGKLLRQEEHVYPHPSASRRYYLLGVGRLSQGMIVPTPDRVCAC